MPIVDKYSEMGTVVIGKVESGQCKKGDILLVMPNKTEVKVDQLWSDDIEVTGVTSGENIKAKVGCFEDVFFSWWYLTKMKKFLMISNALSSWSIIEING